jgi:hypothetical protein
LELPEHAAKASDLAFEIGGPRRESGALLPSDGPGTERGAQELASVPLVGDPVGSHERHGVAGAESVLSDGLEEYVLIGGTQLGEGEGERRSDDALGQVLLGGGRQARAEREAARHPVGSLAEQAGNGALGEAVLVDERTNDPSLVERGERPRRGVGGEQEPLLFGGRRGSLDQDGYSRFSSRPPAAEALEAVEHLEATVLRGDHAQRQLGAHAELGPWRARTETGVAGAQLVQRKVADAARGLLGGAGRGQRGRAIGREEQSILHRSTLALLEPRGR